MNFDGTPVRYEQPQSISLPLSPRECFEPEEEVVSVLINSSFGIYIPQMFVHSNSRIGEIPDWAWDDCKKGPISEDDSGDKNYDYWDAWSEVLDCWGYETYESDGNIYRYFLAQDGDLCLMREFVSHEPE